MLKSKKTGSLSAELVQAKQQAGYYWPLGLVIVLVVIYQAIKFLAEKNLGPGTGSGFQLGYQVAKGQVWGAWLFIGIGAVAIAALVGWYIRRGTLNPWLQLAIGLITAGLLDGLIDRILKGGLVGYFLLSGAPVLEGSNIGVLLEFVGIGIALFIPLRKRFGATKPTKPVTSTSSQS